MKLDQDANWNQNNELGGGGLTSNPVKTPARLSALRSLLVVMRTSAAWMAL